MADPALQELWAAVRADFARARAILPDAPIEHDGSAARLAEWLAENELELALDELEALGDDNAPPPSFWRVLGSAAGRMGLVGHARRYTDRADRPQTGL